MRDWILGFEFWILLICMICVQKEKEDLEEISSELELVDEEDKVP